MKNPRLPVALVLICCLDNEHRAKPLRYNKGLRCQLHMFISSGTANGTITDRSGCYDKFVRGSRQFLIRHINDTFGSPRNVLPGGMAR